MDGLVTRSRYSTGARGVIWAPQQEHLFKVTVIIIQLGSQGAQSK